MRRNGVRSPARDCTGRRATARLWRACWRGPAARLVRRGSGVSSPWCSRRHSLGEDAGRASNADMTVWVLPHCYVHEVQCVLGIVRYADHVGVIFGKQHHFESQAQSPNGDGTSGQVQKDPQPGAKRQSYRIGGVFTLRHCSRRFHKPTSARGRRALGSVRSLGQFALHLDEMVQSEQRQCHPDGGGRGSPDLENCVADEADAEDHFQVHQVP
jgi:hypothetical protein